LICYFVGYFWLLPPLVVFSISVCENFISLLLELFLSFGLVPSVIIKKIVWIITMDGYIIVSIRFAKFGWRIIVLGIFVHVSKNLS